MIFRVSAFAFLSTLLTTYAGSSSKRSTASSTKRSSIISVSSVSVADLIMCSWVSSSKYANTSEDTSLGSIRNTNVIFSISRVSRNSEMSTSFISMRSSLSSTNLFFSVSSYSSAFLFSIFFLLLKKYKNRKTAFK